MKKMNMDQDTMTKEWAICKKAKQMLKFGGGFYCAKFEYEAVAKETIYVINGFYMDMRSSYVKQGAKLAYFVVEWN
jgi:hypothetical protein